jgi:hypothetical protein
MGYKAAQPSTEGKFNNENVKIMYRKLRQLNKKLYSRVS